MRCVKSVNLTYSCHDVVWSHLNPHLVATAATNGSVVLWNVSMPTKQRQHHVFLEHGRTVNKVNFHHNGEIRVIVRNKVKVVDLPAADLLTYVYSFFLCCFQTPTCWCPVRRMGR